MAHIDALIASLPAAQGTEQEKLATLETLERERGVQLQAMQAEVATAEALLASVRAGLQQIADDAASGGGEADSGSGSGGTARST